MAIIETNALTRTFSVPKKVAGFMGAVRGLVHREYQTVTAVRDVTFSIEEGECVGFIGPNGAGKTTTLKMLSGLLYPSSGSVTVLGHTPFDRQHDFLKSISLVMGQKNQLWWDLPAMDSFLMNKEIYGLPDRTFRSSLKTLVELMDVGDQLQTPVRKLSLGQRMKMELIAALIHEPKVLFLDEPTIGLDVMVQQNVRQFIKEYNQQKNATILLTSHYMGDVRELCSRIIIINHGSVLYDGTLQHLIATSANEKFIRVVLSSEVAQKTLERIAPVTHRNETEVTFAVSRSEAAAKAAQILEHFDVLDLTIEEPSTEEIIRDLFVGAKP